MSIFGSETTGCLLAVATVIIVLAAINIWRRR